MPAPRSTLGPRVLVALLALAAALGVAELLLRTLVPPTRDYFVLPPGVDWTLNPPPGAFPGISGESHFRVNAAGIRGRSFGDDRGEYRMLAVGGSTTRCAALDDSETWTHLLEAQLGTTVDGRAAWVGNVGRDATTTRDHVLHMKYLLPQYPHIDAVIALVGVNDMMSALQWGWQYREPAPITDPAAERQRMSRAFYRVPGRLQDLAVDTAGTVPWYKATALWQVARRVKMVIASRRTLRFKDVPHTFEETRRRRQTAATWFDSLPPLDPPLFEYRRNLNLMADLAAARGVRLVLVTQPSLWRADLPAAEQRLLVFGEVRGLSSPGRAYFTTRALGRAMARYNETLLEVCRARGLDCVDAAKLIPRDTTAMYDDVHFNEHGARLLAAALAAHFRALPPFRRRD
jgi:lysophospholipase L1-like esterase